MSVKCTSIQLELDMTNERGLHNTRCSAHNSNDVCSSSHKVTVIVYHELRYNWLQLPQITLTDNGLIEVKRQDDFDIFVQMDNVRAIRFRYQTFISITIY